MRLSKWNLAMASAAFAAVPLMAAQPAATADRLLHEMKSDAQVIQTHATALEGLSKDPATKWLQFDQQWNEIKPAQEALVRKLERLESMTASLSDQQRKSLEQSKQAAQQISARTRQLYLLIDQPGANLKSAGFRADAQSLAKNAAAVAQAS